MDKQVNNDDISEHQVICKKISHRYESKYVVDEVSFLTDKDECLVILGTNGAGKTTTFKSIVGQIKPENGNVYITGLDVHADLAQVRKITG